MPDRRPPLVVVAEDHDDTRSILGEALWLAGYQVQLAADGVEALAWLEATPPDLLLLDLRMPRLSGIGVLRALRARETGQELPVIAFTAWGPNETTAEAERLGCRRVISKPADPRSLVQAASGLVPAPVPRNPTQSPWTSPGRRQPTAAVDLAGAIDVLEDHWRRWRPRSLQTPPSVLARRLVASAAGGGYAEVAVLASRLATLLDAVEDTDEAPRSIVVAIAIEELRTAVRGK